MKAFRRRTREMLRHERACVLQQLGADAADQQSAAAIEINKARAAELARRARKGGGRNGESLGVVIKTPSAEPCSYCGIVGGHTADCPVIS